MYITFSDSQNSCCALLNIEDPSLEEHREVLINMKSDGERNRFSVIDIFRWVVWSLDTICGRNSFVLVEVEETIHFGFLQ